MEQLETQLYTSVRHALCDLVCEYYAFTAPLCEVPHDVLLDSKRPDEPMQAASRGDPSCSCCYPVQHMAVSLVHPSMYMCMDQA